MPKRPTASEKDQRRWFSFRLPEELRELFDRVLELFMRITSSKVQAIEAILLAAEEWILAQERARQESARQDEFTGFRLGVMDRDRWACRFPRLHACDGNNQAHHIVPTARCSKQQRTSVDNGITLCDTAHKIVHNEGCQNWAARLREAQYNENVPSQS